MNDSFSPALSWGSETVASADTILQCDRGAFRITFATPDGDSVGLIIVAPNSVRVASGESYWTRAERVGTRVVVENAY